MSTFLKPAISEDALAASASIFGAAGGSEGERSEPERTPAAPKILPIPPNPEVVERPVRRRFTSAYKQRVLAELDAAAATGESGAIVRLLRREGLYSSQPTKWRQARDRAEQAALEPQTRGPKPIAKNPLQAENLQLKREKAQLQKKLHTAELMLELQKKVSELLGITLPLMQSDNGEENS